MYVLLSIFMYSTKDDIDHFTESNNDRKIKLIVYYRL